MITFIDNSFNIDINGYKKLILDLEVKLIKCPYCHQYEIVRHGYYKRMININNNTKHTINILRIRCKSCKHTHAILPSFIIPYEHNTLLNQLETIKNIDNINWKDINEYRYRRLRKIYNRYKAILISLNLSFKSKLTELVSKVSEVFRLCLFQIHLGMYFILDTFHTS